MLKRFLFSLLPACLLVFLIAGCHSHSRKNKVTQNTSVYTTRQYSDCQIDSMAVMRELERDSGMHPFAEDVLSFYQRRGYEAAWLDGDTLTQSAHDFLSTLDHYEKDFGDSSLDAGLEDPHIERMMVYGLPDGKTMVDLRLTATFFRYAQRVYNGTSADLRDLEWYIPRMKKDYQRLIDTLVRSPGTYSIYEPVNAYYKSLKKVLVQYRAIEKNGGLPLVSSTSRLRPGDSSVAVIQLRRALLVTGDYAGDDTTAAYNDRLTAAVLRYQGRLGLRMTGQADTLTLAEINTPIAIRIRQIMLNMERLRWLPDSLPASYIFVNIPEYRLHVYEDNIDTLSMDVVVGRAASATSIFTGRLSVVDICPYWNVPVSIIKNEMLPQLKKNPGYITKNHLEVLSRGTVVDPYEINWNKYTSGVPYDIRQVPGPDNSLGLVAFFFPNSFSIYLHDTPAKSLFGESSRAFSHGCIRLSDAARLADYVFRHDPVMTPSHIRELMDQRIERKYAVNPNIPVYIAYFTAWVDPSGHINFRPDIYGLDTKLSKEIFGR
jgi:murein L,D-transpeptidase YcbB/YkuD